MKRFKSVSLVLKSAEQEIKHYGLDFDLEQVKVEFKDLKEKVEVVDTLINS